MTALFFLSLCTWERPENIQLAIEECRSRKRFLRDLNTNEKVRAALCVLCGRSNYMDI